jgi:serpin B
MPVVDTSGDVVPGAEVPARAVSESINRFGFDFYGPLSRENSESNLLLSPFSIASALAMTLTGARGATAGQLADVRYFNELGDQLQAELRELRALHEWLDSSRDSDLRVANGLWGHTGYEFLDSFREDVMQMFGGVVRDVDFRSDADSRQRTRYPIPNPRVPPGRRGWRCTRGTRGVYES